MRCPYCNNFNADNSSFCKSCGRSLTTPPQHVPRPPSPYGQPPHPQPPARPDIPPQAPVRPGVPLQPPARPPVPRPQPPVPRSQPPVQERLTAVPPVAPPPPVAPEPPGPFPPRTIEQLHALEKGALPYTLVSETAGYGRRKTVRIVYPRAAAWQQVATLLRALKEYNANNLDTVIVQGVITPDTDIYNFTNGQLCFDRNVRLGDRMLKRYQIETGNGFSNDSLRIVLSEE